MKFEFLDHTADLKFRAYGKTLNETFENASLAISSYVCTEKIKSRKARIINISGDDINNLLYNFIEEIIYLLDAEKFVTCKSEVIIRGNNLTAELFGDDSSSYQLNHIKAPTYSEMHILKKPSGWEIQAVLDI